MVAKCPMHLKKLSYKHHPQKEFDTTAAFTKKDISPQGKKNNRISSISGSSKLCTTPSDKGGHIVQTNTLELEPIMENKYFSEEQLRYFWKLLQGKHPKQTVVHIQEQLQIGHIHHIFTKTNQINMENY